VYSVSQRLNLRHLHELLGGLKACLKQWVLRRQRNEQALMLAGSEFQTDGAATLKLQEAKVV